MAINRSEVSDRLLDVRAGLFGAGDWLHARAALADVIIYLTSLEAVLDKHNLWSELGQDATIDRFHGEYQFLSNFYPSEIVFLGRTWSTAEHIFQASKTTDETVREAIRLAPSPTAAKRMGRRLTLRPEWEGIADFKLATMYHVVQQKFSQNPDLAERLIATGDAVLIEGNTWGDRYWGQVNGEGENHLGLILMRVREEIR